MTAGDTPAGASVLSPLSAPLTSLFRHLVEKVAETSGSVSGSVARNSIPVLIPTEVHSYESTGVVATLSSSCSDRRSTRDVHLKAVFVGSDLQISWLGVLLSGQAPLTFEHGLFSTFRP